VDASSDALYFLSEPAPDVFSSCFSEHELEAMERMVLGCVILLHELLGWQRQRQSAGFKWHL
jgi:hypothetical protein